MNRNGLVESLVGIVVLAVASLFFLYAYNVSGRSLNQNTYQLNAIFGKIDGITVGTDVRIAGVKIGTVSNYALDTDHYEAKVSMAIEKAIPVPEDSIAKIVSDGILGGAHIALEPGASEDYLGEGDVITITQGSVDLLGLAVEAFTSNAGKQQNN